VLSLLIRVLLVLLLLRLVFRFVAGVVRGMRAPAPASGRAAELVRDPLCNTFVAADRAVHGRFQDHEALFCSTGCRDRAAALPGTR
jgi:hypothetical protein